MREFQVSTKELVKPFTVRVLVYDTKKAMVAAAHRYSALAGLKPEPNYYEDAGALTHSYEYLHISSTGARSAKKIRCIIRMHRGLVCPEVVAHEATHAALAYYRFGHKKTIRSTEDEETLAYIVGQLTAKISNKLWDYDLWK